LRKIIYTFALAFAGGYAGIILKIPAGALIGAMFAVGLFNMHTGKGNIPNSFRTLSQITVGGIIGLNFTAETLSSLKYLFAPALILVLGLMLYCILLGFIIHKLSGLDLITSLFSTSPGGLADTAIISDAYGADTPKVALLHLVRLISVISLLPAIIGWFTALTNK